MSALKSDPRLAWVADHDWSGSATNRYPTIDPATGETLAEVPDAGAEEVAATVARGLRAYPEWRATPLRTRAATVRRLAALVREHGEELAALDALDSGNPIRSTRNDVEATAQLMEATADLSAGLSGETIPASPDHLHYTLRQPYGVVARIVPFNHPLFFTAAKLAAPLVAGNAVVIKAPDQAPLAPLRVAELFAGELPEGLFSVLTGRGATAGDALVRHPDVHRIAFVGSGHTGRAIQRAAAEVGVKTVTLELGGKNPLIAFPDVDLDAVAAGAVAGMNFNTQGQSCGSTSRLLAHSSIVAPLVDRIVERTRQIQIGPPLDEQSEMGPLVSAEHRERVLAHIEVAEREGARLCAGGHPPRGNGLEAGFYLEPTVFDRVEPTMRIAREEIFGPVLSVLTFETESEAVALANAVEYGLTASVYTNDLQRAHRVADSLEAGYVWLNAASRHFWGVPFGGWKASGVGTEEGLDEILGFTRTKAVHLPLGRTDRSAS